MIFLPQAVVLLPLNAYTGIVLLRCRKEFYRLVWSALPFITYFGEQRTPPSVFSLNTLYVGGRVQGVKVCNRFSIGLQVGGYSCSPAKGKILFSRGLQDSEANTFHKLLTTKLYLGAYRYN